MSPSLSYIVKRLASRLSHQSMTFQFSSSVFSLKFEIVKVKNWMLCHQMSLKLQTELCCLTVKFENWIKVSLFPLLLHARVFRIWLFSLLTFSSFFSFCNLISLHFYVSIPCSRLRRSMALVPVNENIRYFNVFQSCSCCRPK